MSVRRLNFDDISEADLKDLIETGVPEGRDIDYKQDTYGKRDVDKKEALKDITSFANSVGGHLIIGMEETNGVPTRLTGLPDVDLDALINRLESLVRDGVEPRIVGIRMRRVDLTGDGAAVVIRIPRSWNPPHRVSATKSNRFYVRNSGGVHEASVEELRVLFTTAADAHERIKSFQAARIAKISTAQGPVLLAPGARLIVHLIPLSAFGQRAEIDLQKVSDFPQQFRPMGAMGMTPRFNLDGFINVHGGDDCYGYTQVFRNGIVEATKTNILSDFHGQNLLPAGATTRNIVEVVPGYFEGLRALDVPTPIVLMVSYEGVGGAKLAIKGYDRRLDEIESFPPTDALLLPEVIVEDYGTSSDYVTALRPIFDALWNAAGFSRCTYYNPNGDWDPPH